MEGRFFTNSNVAVLIPEEDILLEEKLVYATLITVDENVCEIGMELLFIINI